MPISGRRFEARSQFAAAVLPHTQNAWIAEVFERINRALWVGGHSPPQCPSLKELHLIGASLKGLGRKCFGVAKIPH